jgi:hypothetical protein
MIVLWSNAWRSILVAKNVGGCPGNAPAILPGLAGSLSSGYGIPNLDCHIVRDEVVRLADVREAKMELPIASKRIAHPAVRQALSDVLKDDCPASGLAVVNDYDVSAH